MKEILPQLTLGLYSAMKSGSTETCNNPYNMNKT